MILHHIGDSDTTEKVKQKRCPKSDKRSRFKVDSSTITSGLRVARLEQEMSEVKKTDHSADVLALIRSQVPTAVDKYLGTKLDDALLKDLQLDQTGSRSTHERRLISAASEMTFECRMEGNDSDIEALNIRSPSQVSTTTWFKPIPKGERPATPEPEWTIPPNDFPEPENN
ncbi:hypothetical protein Tco_0170165 [Tanacetum coccineum]